LDAGNRLADIDTDKKEGDPYEIGKAACVVSERFKTDRHFTKRRRRKNSMIKKT
jgi:hypothetical protein